jgi:uncharacterized protein YPO0396
MEEKFYTSSDGTKTPMKDVEFTHLSNALAKRYREIFNSTNKDEFGQRLQEINDIKEEMHKRINEFNDTLKD